MSSTILKAINMINTDKHAVGNLNHWNKSLVNEGAIATEDVENFSIVELSFNEKGERVYSYLKDKATKGYLIAAVEDYMEEYGEDLGNFYNEAGERGRIVVLEPMVTRFDVSNYEADDKSGSAKPIANGMKVHWDVAGKKFIVSNGSVTHSDYATSANQFVVVNADSVVLDGMQTIRIECVK